MLRRVASAALAALCIASGLSGQGTDYGDDASATRLRFGIGGGAIVPRSNARFQDVLAGATGQAFLLFRFAPGLPALRIGADYSRMTFGEPVLGATGSIYGQTRSQFAGIVSARFDLSPGPVRPYLLAGVGAFSIRDEVEVQGSFGSGTAISSTDFGLDAGGGISFRLGRISGFVEARIQNVYAKEGFINTKSIQAIPITFGVIF